MSLIAVWPRRRPARSRITVSSHPRARRALTVLNLACTTFFLLSYTRHGVGFGPYRIDLDVYRLGSRAWLGGLPLYGPLPATRAGVRLPFTYPPVAAVLLSPLALVPFTAATTVLTLASIAAAAGVTGLILRRLTGPAAARQAAAWLLAPVLFIEPVRATLSLGQVNLLLMALVAADCLAREPRWPRGALVGLAAAVKLTPAAFVLYFLLRRDYRAAGTAGLSFAAATAAGFALAWRDSMRYWSVTVLQTSRIGSPVYAGNQSLLAVLARAGIAAHSPAGLAAWLALSAVVTALAWRGMWRALAAGQDCWALSLNALAPLLISPVSWSHHWVWCVPVLLSLAVLARDDRASPRRARLAAGLAVGGLVMFAVSPQWWFPAGDGRELRWAPWEQVLGSSYVLFALLVLALAAMGGLAQLGRRRTAPAAMLPAPSR